MSWVAMGLRIGGNAIVTLLLAIKLPPADVAVILVLLTISNIFWFTDLGLTGLFARMFGYGFGGASPEGLIADLRGSATRSEAGGEPRWDTIRIIFDQHHIIFLAIAAVMFFVAGGIGVWTLLPQVAGLAHPADAWIGLAIVLGSTAFQMAGKAYGNFLLGANMVAVQKRYESVVNIVSSLGTIAVILFAPSISAVAFMLSGLPALTVIINRQLALAAFEGKLRQTPPQGFRRDITRAMWPQAWRMGTGIILGQIVFNTASLIVVRDVPATQAADFLFSLRLVRMLDTFSVTPFSVALPIIARLHYAGRKEEYDRHIERALLFTLPVLTVPGLILAVAGNPLLELAGAKVHLLAPAAWLALVLGYTFLRYGAVHLQIITVRNQILWHVANGATGALFLALLVILHGRMEPTIAYVSAFVAANLVAYAPYCVWHSYPWLSKAVRIRDALIISANTAALLALMLFYSYWSV